MIRTTVRFVLLLQDDFSGVPTVPGGHAFCVSGRPVQPIRKQGGYYVFTQPVQNSAIVNITSAAYQPCTLRIDAALTHPPDLVRTVRLYRRPGLSFQDCAWLRGTAKTGKLAVGLFGWETPLLLKEFCGEGRAGFKPEGYFAPNVSGQCLCIGEKENTELLIVRERLADGSYTLQSPPRFAHQAGEAIYRACRTLCGEDGRYCMPAPPAYSDDVRVIFYDEEADRWDF